MLIHITNRVVSYAVHVFRGSKTKAAHDEVLNAVLTYFEGRAQFSSQDPNSLRCTQLPPLYLQTPSKMTASIIYGLSNLFHKNIR